MFLNIGRWLSTRLSTLEEIFPLKKQLINLVFKRVITTLLVIKLRNFKFKKKAGSWSSFLKKIEGECDIDYLALLLLNVAFKECESRVKPFWNEKHLNISRVLPIPELNPTKESFKLLKKKTSSTESYFFPKVKPNDPPLAAFKTIKVRCHPTKEQKIQLNEYLNTSRYIYNKTLELIKNGHPPNFQNLRDLLVTSKTKKENPLYLSYINEARGLDKESRDEKRKELRSRLKSEPFSTNPNIQEWELNTPKEIRASAVKRCCDAFKTAMANIRMGNINTFDLKYKKKENRSSMELAKECIKLKDNKIVLLPRFLAGKGILKTGSLEKICSIEHNVDLVKDYNIYWLYFCIPVIKQETERSNRIAAVDPGIRTLATVFSVSKTNTFITQYSHKQKLIDRLNAKIDRVKHFSKKRFRRKRAVLKLERKKKNVIDSIHWGVVNDLLKHNDVIYFGDIKSHDIVKKGDIKIVNRNFNDLKFYQLKQRLLYKAFVKGKKVVFTNECYTSKTCSSCGKLNTKLGASKNFNCPSCGLETDRDANAAKNIFLKSVV
jgi:putative transposase